jgi:hypothetical protein
MSLVNITDRAIEPKSIHFTDGGVFEPDPASDTLQTADWTTVVPNTPLQDNQKVVVPLGSNFNTGHAYHISCNLGLNAIPNGGVGAAPDTFLNSWEIGLKMGGQEIYSTATHWTSVGTFDNNYFNTMATTNVSLPISFIIVVDTTRTLDLYLTSNADYISQSQVFAGVWSINADPSYVVTGKVSYIDLGQVTVVKHGTAPPPPPLPPVYDPVPDLLTTQGGIYNNIAGFYSGNRPTNYIYPPIV